MKFDWNAPMPPWTPVAIIVGSAVLVIIAGGIAERAAGRRWETQLFRFSPPDFTEEGCFLCGFVWVVSVGCLYAFSRLPFWAALPLGIPLALAVCAAGTLGFQLLCQLIVPVVNWVMDWRRPRDRRGRAGDGNEGDNLADEA